LEDLEFSSAAAIKAKKTMELELADLQQQIDDLFKSKQEVRILSGAGVICSADTDIGVYFVRFVQSLIQTFVIIYSYMIF